ncbi:hypothetical protein D6D12_04128 [Aureobasidium pullulans]|uniref:Eisosome protein 1 n=1 Tax=Aureobasidium pullulans TaxID=5580 RepID=A0AB74JW93_AURPU|nr:hypothetical protein D6D12_04128 [Aureobasidium pullulans]THX63061.1 hypothetical protein D6D11_02048 [Aureobasidium pullulans]
MESAEVKSTGDTTFLLEQHTPDPTPIEEKQAPMNASNPIEKAKSQITAPSSTPDPTPSRPTATTDTTSMTATPGPIKTTTNVYPAESDSQPSTQSSDRTATASAPIKTTINVYPSESISQPPTSQSTQSTQPTQSRTATSGKRDTRNSNAASSATAGNTKSNMQSSNTAPLPLADSSEYAPSTTTSFIDKHDIVCPDPTAHRDTRLQEQASTAALYVTKTGKNSKQRDDVLDSNNKLSSRSAAASLKYASPRDLPSYPVVGIDTTNSAHSAANLANSGHKQFEHWKPDPSKNAGIAAMAAKDYKMAPMWKPELSAAGSKAALLAHKDGPKLNLWQPEASAEGNSAAGIAMRNKNLGVNLDYGYTEDGHKKALMAATGALGKSRSTKAPPVEHPRYPDSANSAHNALNAATMAHRPATTKSVPQDSNSISSDAMRAARVQNMGKNVSRDMFGSAPPVDLEVEEKKKQAALRASAISMAKQMYTQTEKRRRDDEAAEVQARLGTSAATVSHNRVPSAASTQPDLRQQAVQYIHLQEAAQKLANERLAKMDPDGAARYRAHYGYEQQSPRSRLSLRNRPGRNRAESNPKPVQNDDDDSSDDEFRSRRIRHQMSSLNNSVAQQDEKRTQDRAALLAAAEKKVQAQMHTMDEQVFQQTGQVTPAMMEEWEAKARARATVDSENRQRNFGKVNIGGGKYMDQSELDAIAQSRLQPTLNEINDNAEKKRARDEEIRLDQEERRRVQMSEKEREKEVKAESKRLKNQEKAEAKAARQAEKELEKSRKAEEKQARKDDKRRSKEVKRETEEATQTSVAAHAADRPSTSGAVATTTTTDAHSSIKDEDRDVDVDRTPAVDNETVAATDGAPLEKSDSPDMMTRIATGGTVHSTKSGLRPELDRHVSTVVSSSSSSARSSLSLSSIDEDEDTHPVAAVTEPTPVAETTAVTLPESEPVGLTSPTTASSVPFQRRKSSRMSGFFSRFNRKSKPAEKTQEQPKTTAVTLPPTEAKKSLSTSEPSTTEPTGVTAVAPVTSDVASDSSFRRHDTDLHSISSLSSDEQLPTTRPSARRGRSSISAISGEEDEFEEARDHFDETLAPPPTFGGQQKNQSPARETKFQEEF